MTNSDWITVWRKIRISQGAGEQEVRRTFKRLQRSEGEFWPNPGGTSQERASSASIVLEYALACPSSSFLDLALSWDAVTIQSLSTGPRPDEEFCGVLHPLRLGRLMPDMDIAERTAIIARLLTCSDSSARVLAEMVQPKSYRPRTYLSHQGEMCDEFWLVLDGTVQLRANSPEGQTTVISACGAGEMIGAYDVERDAAFDTYAYTLVNTLSISALRLSQIVAEHPDLARGLARIFSGQLSMVLERLANRVTLSAVGRFYQELLKEAGEDGRIEPPPIVSVLALSAQTTRETGSRAMSRLERRGVIQRTEEHLTIVSRRILEEMIL